MRRESFNSLLRSLPIQIALLALTLGLGACSAESLAGPAADGATTVSGGNDAGGEAGGGFGGPARPCLFVHSSVCPR
jgi:hypothetical protein